MAFQQSNIQLINSSVLKEFSKYKQKDLKNIFNKLIDSFEESLLYVFVEDLENHYLIDAFKFYIEDKNNIQNYEINQQLLYYMEGIYKNKYYLHLFLFPYKKTKIEKLSEKFFGANYLFLLNNYIRKNFNLLNIDKIYKKVILNYRIINTIPNVIEKYLDIFFNLLLKHPIKIISFIVSLAMSYLLILMYLKGLKPEEIDMPTLSITVELFIVIIAFFSILYFIMLYLPLRLIGIKTKYLIVIYIILIIFYFFKPLQEVFGKNFLIEEYLKFKKFPRFATLISKDKKMTVLVRFVDNKYIYYNNLCDFNFSKINSQNNALTVLKFLANKANEPLSAIATTKINKILNIKYTINKQEFCKICSCEKRTK